MTVVSLNSATRTFRTGDVTTTALAGIDLTIEKGEFCAITGPSGCGKTTLLTILGMLDGLSDGDFHFQQADVTHLPERDLATLRRNHVGFVFQDFNLIDGMCVWKNVAMPLRLTVRDRHARRRKAEAALALVGLTDRANHLPRQLSGGQQQRVAIARAVVGNPDIVIADEPTGNLDTENSDAILALLQKINQLGKTIIMVTHSKDDADRAKRRISMRDGRIIADDKLPAQACHLA